MTDSTDQLLRRDLADRARRRLVDGLDAELTDSYVHDGGKADYYEEGIVVTTFGLLERCPARASHPADDYEDSTATVARRIGRLALRRWVPGEPIGSVVDEAMTATDDWPVGLRQWCEELDRAGTASVASAATTWAIGAARSARGSTAVIWVDPAQPPAVNVPDRLIKLKGGWDGHLGRGRPIALLVVNDTLPGPGDRLRAGYEALVCALWTSEAPKRVTIASPSSGTSRPVMVDAALLDLAVDRVVEVVGHRAAPDDAPTVTGSWCQHCHLLESCDDGLVATASDGPAPTATPSEGPAGQGAAGSTAAAG